jgi:endonuclease-8
MPEGDTIHSAARRVGAALVGQPIESIETPQERHTLDRWPERLRGRGVRSVDARGKHLFVRFDGDLTLHSHLRMGGWWGVFRRGERWRRSPRRAWLVIRTPQHEVVQFDGPVLELMTDGRTRFDRRIAKLGPDVLADDFDRHAFIARLRAGDQGRGLGDALLDQRTVAGIGNMWKAEACFLTGVDPWRRLSDLSDDEIVRVVDKARDFMRLSVEHGGRIATFQPERPLRGREQRLFVFERAGMPCRRCGTAVRARGQGDDNRTTYWCPECQR